MLLLLLLLLFSGRAQYENHSGVFCVFFAWESSELSSAPRLLMFVGALTQSSRSNQLVSETYSRSGCLRRGSGGEGWGGGTESQGEVGGGSGNYT